MKSVIEFNQSQRKNFTEVTNDFGGPTSTAWVLDVLERCVYAIAQPEQDPSCFGDQETKDDFDVCMSALEYFRMTYGLDQGE